MNVIAFKSEGEIVRFEVAGGVAEIDRDSDISLTSTEDALERRLQDVEELIVKCCTSVRNAIKQVPKPEEVTLEFGVEVGGKVGVPFVTEGSATANFNITVKWKALE